MCMLTKHDIKLLDKKGISPNTVLQQVERFKSGFSKLNVLRPATANDGIKTLTAEQSAIYTSLFETGINDNIRVAKFVPASGAATRMFKDLYQYLENPVLVRNLPYNHPIVRFVELLPRFGFFPILEQILKTYNLNNVHVRKSKAADIIQTLLQPEGLNYGSLPKGLIHFHGYPESIRTAMEEHLVEGSRYAMDASGMVRVHFTVSPEHEKWFKEKLYAEGPILENRYEIGLDVSFSFQKPHTDTIAVTPENDLFRDDKGELLFRPGGHGALIENLNEMDADIVFIKNIDNVVPEHLLETTVTYKKALAGLLISLRNSVYGFLERLDQQVDETLVNEIAGFIKNELFASLPEAFANKPVAEKADYLKTYLNRPIRVCGMVKNEGEPGGGPFWVQEANGQETLQILESSQIDMNDAHQAAQMTAATHFNPVDLVCCPVDYKGVHFDLTRYADPETGFISEKSVNGKPIKALELPGLWNGAMAHWITLFVEVPIETFNPVKTVNDLLRPQHQPVN